MDSQRSGAGDSGCRSRRGRDHDGLSGDGATGVGLLAVSRYTVTNVSGRTAKGPAKMQSIARIRAMTETRKPDKPETSVAPVAAAGPVEAVIISGPRRGEIVQLSDEAVIELS